jgi:hypothetical protein
VIAQVAVTPATPATRGQKSSSLEEEEEYEDEDEYEDESSYEEVVVSAPAVRTVVPPKNKVEMSSFEDSQLSVDRPPRSLQDLREMHDDFNSDSDAIVPQRSERVVVRAEEVYEGEYREDGRLDDFTTSSSGDDEFADEKAVMSADKLLFISLPEPLGSNEEVEDLIDILDHSDPMLRITQSKIRGFRDYLHVVEREEVVMLKEFGEEVGRAAESTPAGIAEQEAHRVRYERRLSELRDRRARFRGLLYDAIQERGAIIQAHLQRHDINFRAKEKLDYWRDRSGLDGWLIGFFVASLIIVVCFVVFLTFPSVAAPTFRVIFPAGAPTYEFDYRITVLSALFVVVGLPFWMAVYKRFQWSALSLNLVLIGWSIEFGLLMHVFFDWAFITGFQQVPLTAKLTTLALYTATSVLISHAVLLGRINFTQGLVMASLQCLCFAIISGFQRFYQVVDNGGAVSVFIFGGLFGLAASFVYGFDGEHHKPGKKNHPRQVGKHYNEELKDHSHPRRISYRSSEFAWLGALLLWVLWPVFNSAFAPGLSQGRVMANTLVALIFSTITAIAVTDLLFGAKFTVRGFINATLSGGVVMGCAASVIVPPWIAALLGIVCGIVSALGEWKLIKGVENRFKVYDTQGIIWVILIPATLAFFVSCIVTAAAEGEVMWLNNYSTLFPSPNQAGYLAASWIIAVVFAVLVGAGTGFLFRYLRPNPRTNQLWTEDSSFHMVGDYAAY